MTSALGQVETVSAARYLAVREETERRAAPLSAEDQTVQSMPDVSPTKWHRAHTAWFFETFLLEPHHDGYRLFDPAYGYLFNSYYEGVGPRFPRPQRGLVSRPGVEDVARYRAHVDDAMVAWLERPHGAEADELVELGLHHEQQHQELLLMDIKHVLGLNPLRPAYRPAPAAGTPDPAPPPRWWSHPGGVVEVGAGPAGFCFDNETPRHRVLLEPFALASRPVTCGDWLAFIDDGGYRRPELWLSDGWAWVQAEAVAAPLYWDASDGTWSVFTLHGPAPLRPAEPVCHVSYYEADAFARWAGARLPTEAEWEVLAGSGPPPAGPALHPRAVGAEAPLLGDVWQWTQSPYSAYPGFRPAAGAVGEYNGKFMVNQQVLRGGACITPDGHVRATYRNFFPPAARWPFTGLRLARDA